jgi:SH3 domain-containing YSC84-like protein 1
MKQFTFKAALFLSVAAIAAAETAPERLTAAAEVFQEIMATPDKAIPQDLLAKAQCVIIIPGLKKGAFVVGGQYGRGFAECRKDDGFGWGAPGAVRAEGGSVGFQIGGSSTDVVMLVMNKRGMEKLLGDKFTLGADIRWPRDLSGALWPPLPTCAWTRRSWHGRAPRACLPGFL